MNVSLNWLKEYVDLEPSIGIEEIIDKLTMSGSKVEKYVEFGTKTENVYTALVKKIENHPTNEKLKVITVDTKNKEYTVVAKIPDIEVGDIIPLALEGAKIIGKEVKVSEVEGVKSDAMICHVLDLGLTREMLPITKASGLIVFPKDVEIGEDVSKVLDLGDYIIEFEITPNRPDCLSVEGLARELAVTFNRPCKPLWQDRKIELTTSDEVQGMSVLLDSKNCNNYVLNVADNVVIKDAPWAMKLKLMKCGYSTINNIVDITNFVMLEMGQPLHAFDRDGINQNKIIVRQARENENITLLDDSEKILNSKNMVIADDMQALAVAGVMGGKKSAISDNTKKVVFEAANFVRGSIRNTSKDLQVRTDASGKYEKGLPLILTKYAMQRVIDLVKSTNSGNISNSVVIKENVNYSEYKMDIDYDKINRIIGINLSKNQIDEILEKLNIKCENSVATIPYYREDIRITEDLAEEVARIYGLDKLPSTMPQTASTFGTKSAKRKFEDEIKKVALANSYNQIYTYTFYSLDTLKRLGLKENDKLYNAVKLSNPLSKEFEYMRTTTVPHMLEALERNYLRKNSEAKLVDVGKVFLNAENVEKNELCTEKQMLTLGIYSENTDFYDIKSVVMKMMKRFNVKTNIKRANVEYLHPGISAEIVSLNGTSIAQIGKISPIVIKNYDLPENTYIAVVDIEKVMENSNMNVKYKELPKFPAVERDIAFIISDDVLSSDIENAIKQLNKDIVEDVTLFDIYKGNQILDNKQSMAYKIILRSQDKTLEDEEINNFMNSLMSMLNSKFNATIRK